MTVERKRKEKPRITSAISIGGPGLSIADLRRAAQADPDGFIHKCDKLIAEGKLSWRKVKSVTNLFGAFHDIKVKTVQNAMGTRSTIMASAFPVLASGMTIAGINEAYDAVPTIGQELVVDREDNKKVTTMAGILTEDVKVNRVDEGKDFPLVGAGDEKFQILHNRNGRRMQITAEMIEENDIAGIIERIDALGELAAELVEEQTLERVCDLYGSGSSPAEPYVLRLNGTPTQLYTTSANALDRAKSGTRVNSNALADAANLEAARALLANMRNSRGKRIAIPVSQMILLVPDALASVASKLLDSELEPGVENEINAWGPRGRYRPMLLSSSKLDDISTSAWYLGCFDKQFVRKWKLRFEPMSLGADTQKMLDSRIAFQARLAWDVEVGARDYVYVVQSLSGTTPPSL